MKTIHKQILEIQNHQIIQLPMKSRILSVANQNEQICIWYGTDTKHETTIDTNIYIFGTGHEVPNDLKSLTFIGTVLMAEGKLVWHVFCDD